MTLKTLFAAALLALPLAGLAPMAQPASAMPMIDPAPAVLSHAAPAAGITTVHWHGGWGPGPYRHRGYGWHRGYGAYHGYGYRRGYGGYGYGYRRPGGWHHRYGWQRPWGYHRHGWHHGWGRPYGYRGYHRWHRW